MIDSQRSSRLNMSKKSLPQNNQSQQNFVQNSASSKGTPSFQNGQRVKKGLTNMPNSNNNVTSHKNIQNHQQINKQQQQQQSTKRKPQNTPMIIDNQAQNNFRLYHNQMDQTSTQQKDSKNFTNTNRSMKAAHKKNQPSLTSNSSSAQVNQHFQQTNKHLRFDSIQDSSSATNHQLMSITSQHYQGLISGSSSDIDNQNDMDDNMRDFREAIMTESPQQQKNQITLSNSLLECVDQYGNNIDQYSVLMNSEEDQHTSSKKEFVSELTNPNSYLNTITKDLRAYGSIHQEDGVNVYNVQLANIVSNPNFVVCSPSAQTDDDCQYTNSSAMRSIVTGNSEIKNQHSSYNKRQAQLIYTEERKEEDLSSQAIDEMDHEDNNGQFSSDDKDQYTRDNGEEEEIESKLNMITGSSQIYQTKDYREKGSSFVNDSTGNQRPKFEYVQQTPAQQNQYFQVLDSDSRQKIINDTPQVMQMIDQTNLQSSRTRKSKFVDQNNQVAEQLSPEVLGPRENRRKAQRQDQVSQNQKDNQTRNSSRYLNFKDISPLVKSCNTFVFENTLPNQSTMEMNISGKISPPFLQNHYPSLIQKENFRFNNTMQTNQTGSNYINNQMFLQTLNPQPNNNLHNQYQNNYHTTQGTLVNIHDKDVLSPSNLELNGTTLKQSSVMESPPPLTETSPEKGIKDFTRQYLNHGMWPTKLSQNGNDHMFSKIQDISMLSSNKGTNNSMRMGEQIKRLENQMSSVSKKIYLSQQQQQQQQQFQTQQNNVLYSTADMLTQAQTNGTFQNPSHQQNLNMINEKLSSQYPNIDQSIVQKINTTLDNMNNQFYFKRPSEHVGLGNSTITQLRTSRDHSKSNNVSGINLLSHFNHPNQIGTHQVNTMGNNTVFNQSSFEDMCNINNGDQTQNLTHIYNNDIYGAPLTSRSNNNVLNQSKLLAQNTSTITNNPNNISQSLTHRQQAKSNNTSQLLNNNQQQQQQQLRFSNVSDPVKKITLNGFGLGNINQKMQVQDQQAAFNTTDNITTSSQQNTLQSQQQQQQQQNFTNGHYHHNQESAAMCMECIFEKEKRQVTQKAFERALGISLFLMEEIDKLNVNSKGSEREKIRPSDISDSTANNQLQVSRQEIMNLMNQTQYMNMKGQVSPGSLNGCGDTTTHHNSQIRLSRSKSQSMMPVEYAHLQRSLQIPRGAFPGIFNNITPNLSYI